MSEANLINPIPMQSSPGIYAVSIIRVTAIREGPFASANIPCDRKIRRSFEPIRQAFLIFVLLLAHGKTKETRMTEKCQDQNASSSVVMMYFLLGSEEQ